MHEFNFLLNFCSLINEFNICTYRMNLTSTIYIIEWIFSASVIHFSVNKLTG